MKVEVKDIDKIVKDLRIEVSKDTLKEVKDKALDKVNKEVNISGFRKGKAPLDLIEKRYPDLAKEKILKEAIPFYYGKALTQEKIEPVGMPQVKDAKYSNGNLSFTAQVEIRPEIKVDEKIYKNIKVKINPVNIEDKEIDKFIEQFTENLSKALDKKKEEIDKQMVSKWAGYRDPEEFNKAIRSELYLNKIVQRRREIEKKITDNLLSKINIPTPKSLVAEHKRRVMNQQIQDLQSKGFAQEDIEKHRADIDKRSESLVNDQIRLFYVLEEIAKKENLKYDRNNLYEVVIGFILSNIL